MNITLYLEFLLCSYSASTDMIQGIYLKKDDPKIIALMQQAELLSSLALKFDTENKDQSIDSAWKVRQFALICLYVKLHRTYYNLISGVENLKHYFNNCLKLSRHLYLAMLLYSVECSSCFSMLSKNFIHKIQVLQEFLNQSKDADMIRLRITDVDFQLENSKGSVDDLKFSREDIQQSWRY